MANSTSNLLPKLSLSGTPGTVQPMNVSSGNTMGSSTPKGLTAQVPVAPLASTQVGSSSQNSGGSSNTGGSPSLVSTNLGGSTSTYNQPGGFNALGTHIMTQDELNAQNAQNNQTQQNKPQGLFSSVVSSLANRGTTPNATAQGYTQNLADTTQNGPFVQKAQDLLNQQQEAANEYGPALANITNTPGLLANQNARAANLTTSYGNLMQGLAQTLQGANTAQSNQQSGFNNAAGQEYIGQGQQITALNNAAGLVQPQLAGYDQQVFNPATGQMSSGQGNSSGSTAMSQLPSQGQSAVTSYAQQVQNGSMTRADAESRLSAYGQPGKNALNEILGPGFNTNASNASAGTTATGQQVQTAAQSTNAALDTLTTAFNSLPGWQTGGVPATNNIGQWIGQQFGDKALTQYKTNLADARSQLIGVLNSSGGTPTGNEATANEYLPDNMTKAQFDTNVGTTQNPGIVRQLVAQKVNAFTGSGQQTNTNQTSIGGTMFGSFFGS